MISLKRRLIVVSTTIPVNNGRFRFRIITLYNHITNAPLSVIVLTMRWYFYVICYQRRRLL